MSSVGKEVLSYCTSCKMDLMHLIAAMKGERIAKVECKTCKKTHAYRAPKGITEPPKKKKSKSAAPVARSIEAEWEKLMSQHKAAPTKAYSVKGRFNLGEKITHPTFGDGIVDKLVYPNKIEVLFRNDVKLLIHAGPVQ